MANPAQLLLERFHAWRGPNNVAATNARSLNGANWDEHTQAVLHLKEIEELLRLLESQGRNTRVPREALPSWYQVVFAFPSGWSGGGTATINQEAINTLEMLAERLQDVVPTVEPGGIEQVIGYVDAVRDVLVEDASLPAQLRSHINDVIEHVRWCAENYSIVGDFSLQDALERLSGAIMRGAFSSTDKSKWQKVAETWVWPFVVNMAAALPSAGLVAIGTAAAGAI